MRDPRLDKKCQTVHDSGVVCLSKGLHATHVGGFGVDRVSWENTDYRPLPKALSHADLVKVSRSIQRNALSH